VLIVVDPLLGRSPLTDALAVVRHLGEVEREYRLVLLSDRDDTSDVVACAFSGASAARPAPNMVVIVGGDRTVRDTAEGVLRALPLNPRSDRSALTAGCGPAFLVVPEQADSVFRPLSGDAPIHESLAVALGALDRGLDPPVGLAELAAVDPGLVLDPGSPQNG
jgi:hypothetical protein